MRLSLRMFLLSLAVLVSMQPFAQNSKDALREGFLNPPDDARPLMRWWWFGPAVTKPELRKELETMRGAGIGGVEIQPVYPMAMDDAAKGIRNLQYLSPEFLDAVGFANRTARELGLRVDITLGSGWPYGGPKTTLDLAAGRLRVARVPLRGSGKPSLEPGESILASFDGSALDPEVAKGIDRTFKDSSEPTAESRLYFIAGHTGQQVKRAAFGAEGNVLDHFNRAAIDEHLRDIAEPLLGAFGDKPPYSVFSDSLEVYGADWTANLWEEFRKRRGYDLIPHLPELAAGGTRQAEAVRHDWGKTLDELIRENYLAPLAEFAAAHHTLFRSQTYGDPAVTLADQDVPQLIEGEGMQWRSFSYTRWATSAAHLYGRNVASAETWTWLHSPAFRATPLDMKAEADRMFLLGVNQFVGHGWPYSPESAGEPGWAFYAAAVFNQHNPWFPVMPDIMRYLTRVSWLLRQGEPANDVAILLPEDDAQAAFTPGHVSIADEMQKRISPELMAAVLDAGYNVDYIDAATIEKLGTIGYPVLILPSMERIPLSAYKKIEAYANGGGKVIAVRKTPSLAPGLTEQGDSAEIAGISEKLFHSKGARGVLSPSEQMLEAQLRAGAQLSGDSQRPVLVDATVRGAIGVIRRRLSDREIYFVANTSNRAVHASLFFGLSHLSWQEWDPETGERLLQGRIQLPPDDVFVLKYRAPGISVDFAPYQSRVFVLSDAPLPVLDPSPKPPQDGTKMDLSSDWKVAFGEDGSELSRLKSWTELPNRLYYSGEAVYARDFTLDQSAKPDKRLLLDFGEGTPIKDDRPPGADGMHALLDPPVREAAIVYVNGKRAGALWHPPYRLDVTELVHTGENRLEIHVFNTAMNELARQPARDLTALRAKYGVRFEPQDQDKIGPVPSGLLGTVRLMTEPIR
jgi:alpha-L-rhamnosidase